MAFERAIESKKVPNATKFSGSLEGSTCQKFICANYLPASKCLLL